MSAQSNPSGASQGSVADAVRGNWVDFRAPRWTRPYLRLSRADRPIGTWLLLIPCWWGVALAAAADAGGARPPDLWIALGCALGAVLMRGAGCTWNDLTDQDFDAKVARTRSRPLPSGQVTPRGAAAWMVIQALLACAILLTFPPAAIWLGVASLALVAIYPFAKRFTWWPQVFLGLAFNWGALLAWAAHAGGLGWPPVLLYLAGISWTLFYDTIYAHQDREDDALIGVKSTARLFGTATKRWLAGFATLTVALLALAILAAGLEPLARACAFAGLAAMAGHLLWQLRRLDIDDPDGCLTLFRSNRDAGLLLVAGFLLAIAAAALRDVTGS
ncbi:4-hydroxybenzoate octaprenyltransferase [Amaricoccus solimangrovi]|uniref:4-hydroxybenzoate octaprenyltransferase n=1 Tax=Amaricoccus solimangrovi TaxID=2589815 RepID=A0A501WNP1_9RHOB|nr:4-hydroxybenzoate octaprenyltransferase [Amaricoccus solimangrovi]TPE50462.1 4-hydroxybenzoate octaprenyltransferase [Amaricoccus solimangrovi]